MVGGAIARGFARHDVLLRRRRHVLAGMVLLALAVAESKLIWYSFTMRDLRYSGQGLLIEERDQLAGAASSAIAGPAPAGSCSSTSSRASR